MVDLSEKRKEWLVVGMLGGWVEEAALAVADAGSGVE